MGNTMIAPGAPEPAIIGTFDCDRAWWGDPAADWPVFGMAGDLTAAMAKW